MSPREVGTAVVASPAVTAVVPTHRRPELMRQAVQSIIDQDYPGLIEIIVVFDACAPRAARCPDRTPANAPRGRATSGSGDWPARATPASWRRPTASSPSSTTTTLAPRQALRADAAVRGTRRRPAGRHRDAGRTTATRPTSASSRSRRRDARRPRPRPAGRPALQQLRVPPRRPGRRDRAHRREPPGQATARTTTCCSPRPASAPIRLVNEPLVSVRWQGQSYFFGRWADYAEALSTSCPSTRPSPTIQRP